MFVELCQRTRGGGDDHFQNTLAKNYAHLGIFLSGIVDYIERSELPTRLAMNEANPGEAYFAHLNPENYAEHYDERHEDIELRMLMLAWYTSHSIERAQGEDFSKLVLFNAGEFIGALADHAPPPSTPLHFISTRNRCAESSFSGRGQRLTRRLFRRQ